MKKVFRVTDGHHNDLIVDNLKELDDFIEPAEDLEVGKTFVIKVEEMAQIDFDNLPEWDGF
jgi:hypothetical protein